MSERQNMQTIPFIDIRHKNPAALVEAYPEKAIALLRGSRNLFGMASRLASYAALPMGDYAARAWLRKTGNPYESEIRHYADALGISGVYALNLCYEWGCTSGAYAQPDGIALMRVLDWPFPALGEHMVVAHQSGPAGDFYNATWPGVSGIFNAMAPARFCAALNQAPMRRHGGGYAMDWLRNRRGVYRAGGLPPAHLLRSVFECAADYAQAKEMLCTLPVSIPVIYVLCGIDSHEGCVIERLENSCAVRELAQGKACAANHFESAHPHEECHWQPRGTDSAGRSAAAHGLSVKLSDALTWFQSPIANPLSRLAMLADAKHASLRLLGTDGTQPVTSVFTLHG